MTDYTEFLREKIKLAKPAGFEVSQDDINPMLKPHQRDIVKWALCGGRRAIFASFGLGKTFMQCEIMRLAHKHTGGKTLIVCPLGVRQEFKRDGFKLGIDFAFVRRTEEVERSSATHFLTNYESVRFPTPAYHFAIRELGGWERLVAMVNEMTDKELEFFGQKFAKLYSMGERCASWKAAPGREAVPPYFPGSFERENRTRGFLDHIPAPVDALTGRKLDRAALGSGADNRRTEHGGALAAAVATKKRVE